MQYCPELSDIFRHTALAKGLEQDTARSFVHDDDVVARQLVLGVRRHEGNVAFAGCRYLGRRWLWTDRILARFFNLRQCLLNVPLQEQNTLVFKRPLGVAPAPLPQHPQQLLV